jgi:HK97 family phage portal protein
MTEKKTQKRSLFQKIFSGVKQETQQDQTYSTLQMLNGYSPYFTNWGSNPYAISEVRATVDAIARNAAKSVGMHVRKGNDGSIIHIHDQIENLLQTRPNPSMSAYDFLYKMITMMEMDSNAFAYPVWDDAGNLNAIWPINYNEAEFLEDANKVVYVRFYFNTSKGREKIILPYDEVLHLRRFFYRNDMLGDNNTPLNSPIDAIYTSIEGIPQAVKTSVNLRGLLRYSGVLKESDLKKDKDRFVKDYMTMGNNGGVAAIDSKYEYVPLDKTPIIINSGQMKELRNIIYRYFGVSEAIVMSDYNEDQWNAFYESVLEPIAIQLSQEFTTKLFSSREQGFGDSIVFETDKLQYASNKTKVSVVTLLANMGAITLDQTLEIFNMPTIGGEEGNKRVQTLNMINSQLADKYQGGAAGGGGE